MVQNRTLSFLLLGSIMIVFSLYFTFQYTVVKKSFEGSFSQMQVLFSQERWDELKVANSELEENWKKYKYFIAFNNGEQDYSNFASSLSRLKGAIKAKDKKQGIIETIVAKDYFENIMKIVPEP